MRGEGRVGVRLGLSACLLVILAALVWSALSVLAPSGPCGIPPPVVKAIPAPPAEVPPFLRAEEEDSKIAPSFPAKLSPAEGAVTDRGSDSHSLLPTEPDEGEGPHLEPQESAPIAEAKGEGLTKSGSSDQTVQKKTQGQARGQRAHTLTPSGAGGGRTSRAAFTIHVESFQEEFVAQKRAEFFRRSGFDSFCLPVDLPGKGTWHRVLVGTFADRSEAEAVRSSLEKEKGLKGIRVLPLQGKKP